MRLHVSSDKFELRQSYIPTLVSRIFRPLIERGHDGIDEVIEFMDKYHLTKDDFDSLTEIYLQKVGDIPTAVKSAFTRT